MIDCTKSAHNYNKINSIDCSDFSISNYENLDDEELINLFVSSDDEKSFDELVNRYANLIFRIARRITGNECAAEDVLQNVFLILVTKLSTFQGKSKLSTWIYTIATNESLLSKRKNISRGNTEISTELNSPETEFRGKLCFDPEALLPDDIVQAGEFNVLLENAVNELDEIYRVVFQLRDIEGLGNAEVAEILGLSIPAVKSRNLRARSQLRDRLKKYFLELGVI